MILGGFGFQSRMRGLSVDNLVEAEIVLADGRVLMISEHENSGARLHRMQCCVMFSHSRQISGGLFGVVGPVWGS
jgi:hypothetical protein